MKMNAILWVGLIGSGILAINQASKTTAQYTKPIPVRPLAECYAVDGDTLHCGSARIRLLGVDAPEMAGHCAPGRQCVEGDPMLSKAALSTFAERPLFAQVVRRDRYGRYVAIVTDDRGENASCAALQAGAKYRDDYDFQFRIARQCIVPAITGRKK